ncbi:single-stranded DNA-binding protein [Burkholderia cepacia]|uniref:Single-stranded DNA-binding protein n=1 Tax=Burkholderia cepacia TaxID=292 RepID=A0AAX2RBJ9_BURCE|nr:single-stranded DNA-binding protein [Burkholderia cepacia]TES96170.1 single-stranded DNA-binding protein [Burkholderia cepacia]TEU32946.1 single-stranded DNA-binding protein [Burkholderia cepacia]TEU36198.1 single-stranded DNA-binding protein [Burkholderia cepacia]TEU85091.1 single-stranded DNA-binding protein [Burkholderia cepacia]TEU95276.1 single-stranded DNA-binding protein [Burkholderia cepacia]
MGSINKQIILGRLTADAEGRSMPGGGMVANLRIVTYERYQERASGDWKEFADYHRVSVFGAPAELARTLKKDTEVYVEGRTRTRKYQQDGQDRYITEVVANVIFPTGEAADREREAAQPSPAPSRSTASANGQAVGGGDPEIEAPF